MTEDERMERMQDEEDEAVRQQREDEAGWAEAMSKIPLSDPPGPREKGGSFNWGSPE